MILFYGLTAVYVTHSPVDKGARSLKHGWKREVRITDNLARRRCVDLAEETIGIFDGKRENFSTTKNLAF